MKLFKRIFLVLLVIIAAAIYINYPKLNIISGYASKNMASTVFVAHRTAESVNENDNNVPLIKLANVEEAGKEASATVYGLMKRTTICRDGLGCTLVNEDYDPSKAYLSPKRIKIETGLPFPYGDADARDTVFDNVDYDALQKAMEFAYSAPDTQKTRTLLVTYKGHILSERYADGFSKDTPILGWSMTKSVLATLYGILEYQDIVDLSKQVMIETWQQDDRKNINYNHLLRMQSGLEWEEDYTRISDVTQMLFLDSDMSKAQMEKKSIAKPTEIWNYSSGTSNLLSRLLRKQFKTQQEYLDFPYSALIDKIGMNSMLIETDLAGNFVGSSYGWASTRDWAKFGILYLNKGEWNGAHLFDESWVDYITKPTALSDGTYGAHFWLNAQGKFPDVPRDMFSANGYQGQYVWIIPSKDLVVVRTGLAENPDFDVNRFLKDIVNSIKIP